MIYANNFVREMIKLGSSTELGLNGAAGGKQKTSRSQV